ncbi:MAG TPA: hypothetical protein VG248_02815 [Caulobacteraceae bacterium]|jgi:hypothetical protein|nr:hypothetical protein [Caulobacteraceae bacterium]
MNLLLTIENDVKAAALWVEKEADAGLKALSEIAGPILAVVAPAELAALKADVVAFLTLVEGGKVTDLPTLEAALLNTLEALGKDTYGIAVRAGSNIIQALLLVLKPAPVAAVAATAPGTVV